MKSRTITIKGKTEVGYNYLQPTSAVEAEVVIDLEWNLRQLHGGYPVGNHWFHSDYKSKLQQIGFLIMGEGIPRIQWKTMSGEKVQLSPVLAQQIFEAAGLYEIQLFDHAQALKQAVTQPDFDFTTFDPTVGWVKAFWEL